MACIAAQTRRRLLDRVNMERAEETVVATFSRRRTTRTPPPHECKTDAICSAKLLLPANTESLQINGTTSFEPGPRLYSFAQPSTEPRSSSMVESLLGIKLLGIRVGTRGEDLLAYCNIQMLDIVNIHMMVLGINRNQGIFVFKLMLIHIHIKPNMITERQTTQILANLNTLSPRLNQTVQSTTTQIQGHMFKVIVEPPPKQTSTNARLASDTILPRWVCPSCANIITEFTEWLTFDADARPSSNPSTGGGWYWRRDLRRIF